MTDSDNEPVMYLVFRGDLKMPKGKVAAQAGHAVQAILEIIEEVLRYDMDHERHRASRMAVWDESRTKVALKLDGYDAFLDLRYQLEKDGILFTVITDQGRTCVVPGTETCLAIEPMRRGYMTRHVGDLSLL